MNKTSENAAVKTCFCLLSKFSLVFQSVPPVTVSCYCCHELLSSPPQDYIHGLRIGRTFLDLKNEVHVVTRRIKEMKV